MLEQLLAVLDPEEFEHDGELQFAGFMPQDRQHLLHVKVWSGPEVKCQEWQVICDGVQRYLFSGSPSGGIELTSDHVLLWRYNQLQTQLHLHGKPADAVSLAWQLQTRHQRVTDDYLPFTEFLNPYGNSNERLLSLLSGGYGLLAQGPVPLLKEYASVLTDYSVSNYYFDGSWELRVNEAISSGKNALIDGSNAQFSVLLLGDSYVIGTGFQFNRVAGENAA